MAKTITTCVTPDDHAFIDFHRIDVAKLIRATLTVMRGCGITIQDFELLMKEVHGILKKTESDNLAEALAAMAMVDARKNRGKIP